MFHCTGAALLVAGCWSLVAGRWLLVAGGWSLGADCWWLVAALGVCRAARETPRRTLGVSVSRSPETSHQQPITSNQPP